MQNSLDVTGNLCKATDFSLAQHSPPTSLLEQSIVVSPFLIIMLASAKTPALPDVVAPRSHSPSLSCGSEDSLLDGVDISYEYDPPQLSDDDMDKEEARAFVLQQEQRRLATMEVPCALLCIALHLLVIARQRSELQFEKRLFKRRVVKNRLMGLQRSGSPVPNDHLWLQTASGSCTSTQTHIQSISVNAMTLKTGHLQ